MSKKSEKKNRRQRNLETDIVDENMTFVSQDKFFDYLRNIMRRFSGYNFISVSKSHQYHDNDCRGFVRIIIHKNIPIQDANGYYHSDQDQYVRDLCVEDTEFPGVIMDRQKNYTFGNPFRKYEKKTEETKVPNLGEDKVEFKKEDESRQPL